MVVLKTSLKYMMSSKTVAPNILNIVVTTNPPIREELLASVGVHTTGTGGQYKPETMAISIF